MYQDHSQLCPAFNTPINNSPSKTSFISPTFDCDSSENSDLQKENYNPETLSEIADRTLKLTQLPSKNPTSTPKNLRNSENSLDDTFNACDNRTPQKPMGLFANGNLSMSFLTAGFNNMGIVNDTDVCNVTSDEDESFVEAVTSFTDLSQGNVTIVKEEIILDNTDVNMISTIANSLSPPVNDQTFDHAELESRDSEDQSEDQSSPQVEKKVEEVENLDINYSMAETASASNETSTEIVESADVKVASDDIEISSVTNGETTCEDSPSTKPDERDGDEAPKIIGNQDDKSKEEIVETSSPTVEIPSNITIDEENFESPKSSQSAEDQRSPVFNDKFDDYLNVEFKMPVVLSKADVKANFRNIDEIGEDEFQKESPVNFSDSDFDYIEHFGGAKRESLPRDSILLNFDPLCSRTALQKIQRLSVTEEEPETPKETSFKQEPITSEDNSIDSHSTDHPNYSIPVENEMSTMKDISADAKIDINHSEDRKIENLDEAEYSEKMAELENKIKQEAEMREEALLKRISEKDKQITKMNGVVEAYEKAISELIAEKEQLTLQYDKKCNDLKNDSELNANHLASLEATFSDLHSKYERTKQMTQELYDREKTLVHDRKSLNDSLKMQEARYDKMKSHAMAQLEIANNTLAEMNRNHQAEVTRLKALLKKEEIARGSINEQLLQKSKENAELVKICDELINGTQAS